jgi:small conductance mechanosensitive channel
MDELDGIIKQIEAIAVHLGANLLAAIAVLIVGLWVIKRFILLLKSGLSKKDFDPSLTPFLASVLSVALKVVLIISVVSILGVETTSFIAVLGSAGLAVGLALQGSLANFAGGILILVNKPFEKGDFVSIDGISGTAHTINILNTILKTPDNQIIYIPNGKVAGGIITNFTQEPTRRLVLNFGISYSDHIPTAKNLIKEIVEADERILTDPAPSIVVTELADSSVNIAARVWVTKEEYWNVNFETIEKVKMTFDEKGITIPFPQRDVHLFQSK